jgi:hypothetical protein
MRTQIGIAMISIILALGIATLFRKVCSDKNCVVFNGPIIGDIVGKTYKYGEKCYQYDIGPIQCDPTKKTIEFTGNDESEKKEYIDALTSNSSYTIKTESKQSGFFGF